ncbi:hypothetical protein GCM10007301_32010 [Azorhizobium oxalatiphilum]|uniref:Uncharacterized protein n=1 Tax=Azorhizobium oxalatiphilum TaxID=980631 RepID=A0A917FF80_9HYPH|nr:hypothetical protein GCM10007301_32010 [Azorhizobium oxalatiphilum]
MMMTGIGTPRSQSRIAGIEASFVLQGLNATIGRAFPFDEVGTGCPPAGCERQISE